MRKSPPAGILNILSFSHLAVEEVVVVLILLLLISGNLCTRFREYI